MKDPNHLRECELATGIYDDRADCICDALRACELRVRTEPYDVAYLAGLDAAVTALSDMPSGHLRGKEIVVLVNAVAAIRELSQTRTENGTGASDVLRIRTLGHDLDDDRQPILVLYRGELGWEFDLNDSKGEWFAGGTASTWGVALDLAFDYLRAEYGVRG